MAIYAISFRIGDEGDRQSRYKSLIERIEAEATYHTWDETTSFFIIASDKSTDDLVNALYLGSEIHTTWDKLLVVNLSEKSHAAKCNISMPTLLETLMNAR